MIICKNCASPIQGTYCHECGQKIITKRLTVKTILGNLVEILTNVDRGLFFTIKELLYHPEEVVVNYLNGATVRYMNPFRFLLITVGVSTLLNLSLGVYDMQTTEMNNDINTMMGVEKDSETLERQMKLQSEMKKYANLLPLIIVPFISLLSLGMFKRKGYNYAEHLVINSFLFGELAIIGLPMVFLFALFPQLVSYALLLGTSLGILYYSYVTRRLFELSTVSAFFRSAVSYVGGFILTMLTFGVLAFFAALVYIMFK